MTAFDDAARTEAAEVADAIAEALENLGLMDDRRAVRAGIDFESERVVIVEVIHRSRPEVEAFKVTVSRMRGRG